MPTTILGLLASALGGTYEHEGEEEQNPNEPQKYDIDPSNPQRKVKHKKINSPFLKHQRWKEEQERIQREKQEVQQASDQSKSSSSSSAKMSSKKIVELPSDAEDEITLRSTDGSLGKGKGKEGLSSVNEKKEIKKQSINTTKSKKAGNNISFILFKWSLVSILLAIGLGQFIVGDPLWGYRGRYVKKQTYFPPTRKFTVKELSQYDGTNEEKPIYLSIRGYVYDVTPGRRTYGPGGGYHFFAGRDASRAFVTGCFETHLTHDLRGLKDEEVAAIDEWRFFFENNPRYKFVGMLDLPKIDKKSPIPKPCNQG